MTERTKLCGGLHGCHRILPVSAFHRMKITAKNCGDGYQTHCKDCQKRRNAERYRSNPEAIARVKRDWQLSQYGLTRSAVDAMVRYQAGRCGYCGEPLVDRVGAAGAVVDHNHETEEPRGLLHSACNALIGAIGDSVEGARAAGNRRAEAYLLDPPASHALAAGPAYQHRPIRSIEPLTLPI